ncbi:phage tail assembly chaperone [Photobacterium sp. SP02]|uniref:phage tail assembly chaperone n=1 Tax=Photobacterium sp. SP02 TaxID=3032280 RepID=UPI0031456E8B
MIKSILVKGEKLINVPAHKGILVDLGLTPEEAQAVIDASVLETELEKIRVHRAPLLVEADYLVNIALDNNLDIAPFRDYRQKLRDLTDIYQKYEDVIWPEKPSVDVAPPPAA